MDSGGKSKSWFPSIDRTQLLFMQPTGKPATSPSCETELHNHGKRLTCSAILRRRIFLKASRCGQISIAPGASLLILAD
jgi:hypothetical protein